MPTKRAAVASVAFAYEAAALSTGRLPTITELCQRYHWLSAVTVAVLVVHLLPAVERAIQGAETPPGQAALPPSA